MGTPATVHFRGFGDGDESVAITYRQSDGYPEELGKSILNFIKRYKQECQDFYGGARFNNASYLAMRWAAVEVEEHAMFQYRADNCKDPDGFVVWDAPVDKNKLQLLRCVGIGLVDKDPSGIEYRYVVKCPPIIFSEQEPEIYFQTLTKSTGQIGKRKYDLREFLSRDKMERGVDNKTRKKMKG